MNVFQTCPAFIPKSKGNIEELYCFGKMNCLFFLGLLLVSLLIFTEIDLVFINGQTCIYFRAVKGLIAI